MSDSELVRLLAVKVMGWQTYGFHYFMMVDDDEPHDYLHCSNEEEAGFYWNPLTNPAHTEQVKARLRALGYHIWTHTYPCQANVSIAHVSEWDSEEELVSVRGHTADTEYRALCLAAAQVVEPEANSGHGSR